MKPHFMRSSTALLMTLALSGPLSAAPAAMLPFVSGGVTVDDLARLQKDAKAYSLELVFAAKDSGAYLADVEVTIRALPGQDVVLEHRTDGPLLLVDAPPGRYEVTAAFADVKPGASRTIKRVIQVPRQGHARSIVYFDTGDRVGDDSPAGYSIR